MKKTVAAVLTFCLLFSLMTISASASSSEPVQDDKGFIYERLPNGAYKVIGYDESRKKKCLLWE